MEHIFDWLEKLTGWNGVFITKIVKTILVILGIFILNKILSRVIYRQIEDVYTRYRWRKSLDYLFYVIGIFVISSIWVDEFKSLATFFGLLTAGVAIALKDPLTDLAGWLFILWRKPFVVGDRIQIGEHRGDVIDIRIFQFTIIEIGNWVDADQSTGRILHIPNTKVFMEVLANYTIGFEYIWNEIGVLVTFESDWQKAKAILDDILNKKTEKISKKVERELSEASKRYMIFYKNLTPIVYTSVKDSGVMLTLRFLCKPRNRRGNEQKIWEAILLEFAKHDDIDFAYPTQRFYSNMQEGKPGAKAPGSK